MLDLLAQGEALEDELKACRKRITKLPKLYQHAREFVALKKDLQDFNKSLPSVTDLAHSDLLPHHWAHLATFLRIEQPKTVGDLRRLVGAHGDAVDDVVDSAIKEAKVSG